MHQFFQQFTINPQQDTMVDNLTPELRHNLVVLEMCNNWPHVRWLMYRHREGLLKQVDEMEQLWLNYVLQNNIPTEEDKDGTIFYGANIKKLADEK